MNRRQTPCGKNPDGSKDHYTCFKTGMSFGYRKGLEKGLKITNNAKLKAELQGYLKGIKKGQKVEQKYTREMLEKTKKGGLEDIAKRKFNIKNARKKTKQTLIEEILDNQD